MQGLAKAEMVSAPARRGGSRWTKLLLSGLSIASLLAVWMLMSRWLSPRVFPPPWEAAEFLWREWERGRLWRHVFVTMERVIVSFGFAMLFGVAAGLAMGMSKRLEALGSGWLLTGLAVPRIVPIVASYILIGLNDTAAVVAITVSVVPMVVAQVLEGTKAIDYRLVDMARAFERPWFVIVAKVIAPQLFPYIAGTARSAMSLAWKMVVFAELMGRSNGVGYQISFFFQMFDLRGVLAYGSVMIVILYAVDLLMARAWEKFAFRWRPTTTGGAD